MSAENNIDYKPGDLVEVRLLESRSNTDNFLRWTPAFVIAEGEGPVGDYTERPWRWGWFRVFCGGDSQRVHYTNIRRFDNE